MELLIGIPIVIFLVLLFFIYKDHQKRSKEMDELFRPINEFKKKTRYLSEVKPDESYAYEKAKTLSEFVKLGMLSHIYRYKQSPSEFWLDFWIESTQQVDKQFALKAVKLNIHNHEIECDLSLLLEKVPEHTAPPYGNRYYSTKSYNHFILSSELITTFHFQSRFQFELKDTDFIKASDSVSIFIEIQDYQDGKLVVYEEVKLFDYLKNLHFKPIQEIDDKIVWET